MSSAGASFLLALAGLAQPALAQDADSTRQRVGVSGAVSITTKGISTIPSFTLGKPAAIFDVAIAKRALSFEPQFKFGLDGKPWSFTFWWRYKLLERERLHLIVGAHPALAFKSITVSTGATSKEVIVTRRYWAEEVNASYSLSRNFSLGPYYLYTYCLEPDVTKHTHFLALRANLTNDRLPDQYLIRFAPQLYYLKADRDDGYYLYSGLTVAKRNLPLSLSAVVNRPFRTSVAGGEDLIWNMSVNYSYSVR